VAAALRKWSPFLSAADEVVVQAQTKNLFWCLNNRLVCAK
jgi:hypothetical protein